MKMLLIYMIECYKLGLSKFIKAYKDYCFSYKTLKKQKGNSDDFAFEKNG